MDNLNFMNLWFIITPKPGPRIEQISKKNKIIHRFTDLNVRARKIHFHLSRLWLTHFDNNHNNNFALWLKYSSVVSSYILYRLVLLVCKFLIFFLKKIYSKRTLTLTQLSTTWREKIQTYSIWNTLGTELQLTHFNGGNYWCWYLQHWGGGI